MPDIVITNNVAVLYDREDKTIVYLSPNKIKSNNFNLNNINRLYGNSKIISINSYNKPDFAIQLTPNEVKDSFIKYKISILKQSVMNITLYFNKKGRIKVF